MKAMASVHDPVPGTAQGSLRRSVDLLRQLLLREITEAIKGSSLGFLWLVLNPLLMMGLYVVVFGVLFGGRFGHIADESPLAFAVGVYIGLSVVGMVNDTIGKSSFTIQRSANLVKRVPFPLYLLPLVQVLGSGFKFVINALLWLLMAAFVGVGFTASVLLLPVLLLPVLLIALGLGLLLSAISVYFRDLQQVTGLLTQVVFWSSGVFYSSVKVMEHPQVWSVLQWNPVFLCVENVRAVVLWGAWPDPLQLGWMYLSGCAILLLGYGAFHRLRSGFSELI